MKNVLKNITNPMNYTVNLFNNEPRHLKFLDAYKKLTEEKNSF